MAYATTALGARGPAFVSLLCVTDILIPDGFDMEYAYVQPGIAGYDRPDPRVKWPGVRRPLPLCRAAVLFSAWLILTPAARVYGFGASLPAVVGNERCSRADL